MRSVSTESEGAETRVCGDVAEMAVLAAPSPAPDSTRSPASWDKRFLHKNISLKAVTGLLGKLLVAGFF